MAINQSLCTIKRELDKVDKWCELQINIKFYIPLTASDPITNRYISIYKHRTWSMSSPFSFIILAFDAHHLTFWFQFLINGSASKHRWKKQETERKMASESEGEHNRKAKSYCSNNLYAAHSHLMYQIKI